MEREQKKQVVDELRDLFEPARTLVFADYKGLKVDQINRLRRELNGKSMGFRVVKNTLAQRALDDTDKASMTKYLKGPTAIGYTSDEFIEPAKVLVDFMKDNEHLGIKGLIVDGRECRAQDVETFSKLPGRDELRSRLLGALNGVAAKFLSLLSAVPSGVLQVLTARKMQLEEAGG